MNGYLIEKIDGVHSKNPVAFDKALDKLKLPENMKKKLDVIDQLKKIQKFSKDYEIGDFQVMLHPKKGIYVIDPKSIVGNSSRKPNIVSNTVRYG